MKTASVCCLVLALTFAASIHATTWGEPEPVPDPVLAGAECHVSQPASYGSYIYNWPSKYDQVFWPLTDPKGIWFCEKSGLTAFIDDFKVTTNQRAALATELAASYKPAGLPSLREKLALLQKSYALRNPDASMQIRLLRVLAYYHETDLLDLKQADAFRRQALEKIEAALTTKLPPGDRLEYLFVSAVYYRQFDELEKSKVAARSLAQALTENKDEKLNGFVEYLTELKNDIDKIAPGGPLIPERPGSQSDR